MPKILKSLIVMICCFAFTASYSQTKAETIAWLKEKLELSLTASYNYIKDINIGHINECEFTIRYTYINNNLNEYYQYTIPVKGLTIKEERFYFDIQAIKAEELQNKTGNTMGEKEYKYFTVDVKVMNRETDLHNRLIKTFKHLATFCTEKKETF